MWSSAVKPLSPITLHFSSYTNILSNLLKWSYQPILFTYILLGYYDLANYKTHCCPCILWETLSYMTHTGFSNVEECYGQD